MFQEKKQKNSKLTQNLRSLPLLFFLIGIALILVDSSRDVLDALKFLLRQSLEPEWLN